MKNRITVYLRPTMIVAALVLAACEANPRPLLEDVAKDWSLTIRASQVIPVYPLTEDVQPGDVFLVPVSIAKQADIYEEKGFLPTDQLVTRLPDLPYDKFYQDGYFTGSYAGPPHSRPGPGAPAVNAPRTAFPSYSFTVDRAAGLQLALPIQGIPFGLGLMSAARATGTVTISDSHTYGADGTSVYEALLGWYNEDANIRQTLGAMASVEEADVFLRVVTRVYLAGGIDVSLANADETSGGADLGKAQEIKLPDLTGKTDAEVASATKTYKEALKALTSTLNESLPGGSVRFTQVNRSTVSLKQKFDRPLVIGFVGFDVKVFEDGTLSAPIPSFSVLTKQSEPEAFSSVGITFDDDDGGLSNAYVAWADKPENRQKMVDFLQGMGINREPEDLAFNKEFRSILQAARDALGF